MSNLAFKHNEETRPLVTITSDASAEQALVRMAEERVHHLVVMDQGKYMGVVSDRDIFDTAFRFGVFERVDCFRVAEVMRKGLPVITEDTEIYQALSLMRQFGVSGLAVSRKGKEYGIVTESDLLCLLESLLKKRPVIDYIKDKGDSLMLNPLVQKLVNSLSEAGI